MRNRRFVSLWVLALLLPVTLGLACVKRDWSICAPDDKQPCLPGYVCTPNLLCVRATDGGSDGLVTVDSQSPTDAAGASVDVVQSAGSDGPAVAGPDAAGPTVDAPFDIPVSTVPDAPTADLPTGGGGASGSGGAQGSGGAGAGGAASLGGSGTGGATRSGGAATGGATSSGGSATIGTTSSGGSATGGATASGGSATTGTTSSGGSGVGGASGSGGVGGTSPNGGTLATGGASATGGTTSTVATSGTAPINQFTSGPCAVSPDLSSVEVFALGDDHHIHRRVLSGTTWGGWQSIVGLNGSLIDARSDLDCSANTNTIHIVATGSSPTGAFMHATGFGTSYNQFSRELSPSTFGLGVAVGVTQTDTSGAYWLAAVMLGAPTILNVLPGNPSGEITPNFVNQFVSGLDFAEQNGMNSSHTHIVAYDTSAQLAHYHYVVSASPSSWWPPELIAPPVTKTYAFSPTICTESNYTAAIYTRHVAAVAGGKLWYANAVDWLSGFSAWEQMASIDMASSPDCTVTSDSTVHVVALSTTGTVVDVHGKSGSWTTADLGVY